MSSVFVTGCNRGIGLGLTRQLLSVPSVSTEIATARDIDSAKDLKSLENTKLHIITLDVSSEESLAKASETVTEIVGETGLDILINNAGIGFMVPLNEYVSKARIVEVFEVNTIATLFMANV